MNSISETQRQNKINAHVSNMENVLNRNSKMFENMLTTINLIENIKKTVNRLEETLKNLNDNFSNDVRNVDGIFKEQNFIPNDFEEFPGDEVEEEVVISSHSSLQPSIISNIPPNVTENSNYQCNINGCCKKFPNESSLKSHTKRCGLEKKFKCNKEGCCLEFKTKKELEIHFYSHSDERKFSCDLCDCKYKQPSGLSQHKKNKHSLQSTSISINTGSVQNKSGAISIGSITFLIGENSGNPTSPINQPLVI